MTAKLSRALLLGVLALLSLSPPAHADGKTAKIYPKTPIILPKPEDEQIGDIQFECRIGSTRRCTVSSFMKSARVCALLVLKSGKIRLERYSKESICEPKEGPNEPGKEYGTASITKSITSTLLGHVIATKASAVTKEEFQNYLQRPVNSLIPVSNPSGYVGVSIESVLNMRSGIKWNEYVSPSDGDKFMDEVKGGKVSIVDFANRYKNGYPIGSWRYSALDASINGAVAESIIHPKKLTKFMETGIWASIGAEARARWAIDLKDTGIGACCFSATLRDLGRFGLFVLNKGRMPDGPQVIPEGWFELATNHGPGESDKIPERDNPDYNRECPLDYRYQWWLFRRPSTDFTAVGVRGQFIHIYPAKDAVVVQISDWLEWSPRLECASFRAHDALIKAVE